MVTEPHHVAFCGTLREGYPVRHELGIAQMLQGVGECRPPGTLHDLGEYPPLTQAPGAVWDEPLAQVYEPAESAAVFADEASVPPGVRAGAGSSPRPPSPDRSATATLMRSPVTDPGVTGDVAPTLAIIVNVPGQEGPFVAGRLGG